MERQRLETECGLQDGRLSVPTVQRGFSLHHLPHHAGPLSRAALPFQSETFQETHSTDGFGDCFFLRFSYCLGASATGNVPLGVLRPDRHLYSAAHHQEGVPRARVLIRHHDRAQLHSLSRHRCRPAHHLLVHPRQHDESQQLHQRLSRPGHSSATRHNRGVGLPLLVPHRCAGTAGIPGNAHPW